jgi:hypothetical protein
VVGTSRDLVSVESSDPIGWIAERPTSESTKNGVPDAVIA